MRLPRTRPGSPVQTGSYLNPWPPSAIWSDALMARGWSGRPRAARAATGPAQTGYSSGTRPAHAVAVPRAANAIRWCTRPALRSDCRRLKNLSVLSVAVAALTFAAGCSTHYSAPQSFSASNETVAQVVQNALGSGSPAGAAKLDGAGCSPTLTLSKHSEGEEL
jgi:hypothetical protein